MPVNLAYAVGLSVVSALNQLPVQETGSVFANSKNDDGIKRRPPLQQLRLALEKKRRKEAVGRAKKNGGSLESVKSRYNRKKSSGRDSEN